MCSEISNFLLTLYKRQWMNICLLTVYVSSHLTHEGGLSHISLQKTFFNNFFSVFATGLLRPTKQCKSRLRSGERKTLISTCSHSFEFHHSCLCTTSHLQWPTKVNLTSGTRKQSGEHPWKLSPSLKINLGAPIQLRKTDRLSLRRDAKGGQRRGGKKDNGTHRKHDTGGVTPTEIQCHHTHTFRHALF